MLAGLEFSRVGSLALRLREESHLFLGGDPLIGREEGGESCKNSIPGRGRVTGLMSCPCVCTWMTEG